MGGGEAEARQKRAPPEQALDERARGSREERELFVRSRSYSFERAVVKTQQGLPVVDREERRAVQRLLRSGPTRAPLPILQDAA